MNTYTYSDGKKWSDKEIAQLLELKKNKTPQKEIAKILNRTEIGVSVKIKRLNKKKHLYNKGHKEEKDKINQKFLEEIKPKNILDLYNGGKKYDENIKVTTNDLDKKYNTNFNEKAEKLICKLYYEGKKYDYIDLDPFGSAYDCFDLAIKMAKKGLSITLGEMGHKRFKRLDFVKNRYNIKSLAEFTCLNIIKEIQKIGIRNKKELIIYEVREWNNIARVWFIIKPYKCIEQWQIKQKQLSLFE